MISEHQFSNHYSSAWQAVAPLSDGFWAFENLQVERIDPPLRPRAPKGVRSIVNEAAFRGFCDLYGAGGRVDRDQAMAVTASRFVDAIQYVSRFTNAPPLDETDIDDDCREEATSLALRLVGFFPGHLRTELRPRFAGCGLLSACEGDVIEGPCLYEIKAGDRAFRLVDLKQLLTYSTLAFASGRLSFTHIGLFNPRRGVAWRQSLEDVCMTISGQKMNDTLSALVEQFAGASASR